MAVAYCFCHGRTSARGTVLGGEVFLSTMGILPMASSQALWRYVLVFLARLGRGSIAFRIVMSRAV